MKNREREREKKKDTCSDDNFRSTFRACGVEMVDIMNIFGDVGAEAAVICFVAFGVNGENPFGSDGNTNPVCVVEAVLPMLC